MKNAILALIVAIGLTQQSQAAHCGLNKENPAVKGQYDQPLFSSLEFLKSGAKQELVAVKTDGTIVENFDFSTIHSPADVASIDKATIAWVTRNQDNSIAIGLAYVDMSKTEDLLQSSVMALGDVTKILGVFDVSHGLALTCTPQ